MNVGDEVEITDGSLRFVGRRGTIINVIENRGHVTVRLVDEYGVTREKRVDADSVRVIDHAKPKADAVAKEIVLALHAAHGLWCDPNNIEYRIGRGAARFTVDVDGHSFLVTVKGEGNDGL